MELTRKQLERILIAHHRIRPDAETTFRSRIATLQRMGFPPGTNVGRGPKVGYSVEHLLMLVTAFEVQQIGLPADRTLKTVLACWRTFKAGFGAAFRLQDEFNPTENEKILAWIHARSLRDLQFELPEPMYRQDPIFATAITATELQSRMLARSRKRFAYSYLVLDLSDIVRTVVDAWINAAGLDDLDLGKELLQWAEQSHERIHGGEALWGRDSEPDDPFGS